MDQIKAIDNTRLMHRIGQLDEAIKNKGEFQNRIGLSIKKGSWDALINTDS